GVVPRLTLLEAVYGWLRDEDAVVPREIVYPPDESPEETDERNAADFANSLSSAQVAALHHLGYPPVVAVKEVQPESPNADILRAGDVITAIDGTPVPTPQELL